VRFRFRSGRRIAFICVTHEFVLDPERVHDFSHIRREGDDAIYLGRHGDAPTDIIGDDARALFGRGL